jgi:phage replication initiation protein
MRRPVRGLSAAAGRFGFTDRLDLQAAVGSSWVSIGLIAFGGEHQRGRVLLSLTGSGCGLVTDWAPVVQLLEALGATITRLDLAVDYLDGQATVDDAVSMYECDAFNSGGRRPSSSLAGDWLGGEAGRTFYVGKAANGKTLRVYEKGKQLGEPASEWVRFEVQFGNRDRVIPLRALVDRDAFFAGAYPALESMLEVASVRIEVDREKASVSLLHLLRYLRSSYGRVIDTACTWVGCSPSELVEAVRVRGLPRRVDPSAAESGAYTSRVLDDMKAL